MTTEQKQTETETSDINLATFIQEIIKIKTCGHYHAGDQLRIKFPITEEQLEDYKIQYLNSAFAGYDATKRNFLRLLRRR